ncbi:MAG TPA: UbiX family flavin prenyltransferase [Conexivisphaerales archaeon]|nr:UbiX family flavin prenyltransferase [Conexivisphaerales archaeon]
MKLVVAVTGASGVAYGVRLLEELKKEGVETHAIVTNAARLTMKYETGYSLKHLAALSSHLYREEELEAPVASGSFLTDGMAVVPCSMKTLSGIAYGFENTLVIRAAMVALKERRPLLLLVRETPLSSIQIESMLRCSQAGAIVMPASPSFYNHPKDVDEMVDQMVARILDSLRVPHSLGRRWSGGKPG